MLVGAEELFQEQRKIQTFALNTKEQGQKTNTDLFLPRT